MPDLEPPDDGVERRTRAYLARLHRAAPPTDLEDRISRAVFSGGHGRRLLAAGGTAALVAVCAAIAVVALAAHGGGPGGGSAAGSAATGAEGPATPSPSPCAHRSFQLSLAKDTGGQSSPISAAEWFAVHGGVWSDTPTTGWRVVHATASGTFVQSGSIVLETVQGPDGTWQVESGTDQSCSASQGTGSRSG